MLLPVRAFERAESAGDEWLPFKYADFWDVPRLVFVRVGDRALILDAPFNDDLDDYEDSYAVYAVEGARDLSREERLATIPGRGRIVRSGVWISPRKFGLSR